MSRKLAGTVRLAILALAGVALAAGAVEARTASRLDACYYYPPFYLGACANTPQCKDMCSAYWPPNPDIGECLNEPLCCVCE